MSLPLQPLVGPGEQWDILHTQAAGVWRRTSMHVGQNLWGREAEAFLQGRTQEGEARDGLAPETDAGAQSQGIHIKSSEVTTAKAGKC